MTLALLHDFRSRWLTSPLPMVVEHRAGAPETICAAPSLWMGGKLVAERLREQGIGEGHRVCYDGPAGAPFVQALVGILRTGAAFVGEALEGAVPHAVVHHDLGVTVSAPHAANEAASTRMIFRSADGRDIVRMTGSDVDALAKTAAELLQQREADGALRIGCLGDWRDWRVAVIEVLGGLSLGSELHLGCHDVPGAQLEALGSLPDVVIGRPLPHSPLASPLTLSLVTGDADRALTFDVVLAPAGTLHHVSTWTA